MQITINRDNMNDFEKTILRKHKFITVNDLTYFTEETNLKLRDKGLPEINCGINDIFDGCNNADFHRREYCLKNCGLRCLNEGEII